jgi:hypothetical protein
VSSLYEKRSVIAWCQMARRGAEDGHDDAWIDQGPGGNHLKLAMRHAAEEARRAIEDDLNKSLTRITLEVEMERGRQTKAD